MVYKTVLFQIFRHASHSCNLVSSKWPQYLSTCIRLFILYSTVRIVKIKFIPGATAPFFAAGVVPLPAAGLGAGFAAALTGALAATGFLGGILKRSVRKLL